MKPTLVEQFVESPENMRLFQQERTILEITELLEDALSAKGISRAEFAAMLGKSKGWVTQLLDGEGNKTLRTIADAFAVLGFEFHGSYQDIAISNHPTSTLYRDTQDADIIPISRNAIVCHASAHTHYVSERKAQSQSA